MIYAKNKRVPLAKPQGMLNDRTIMPTDGPLGAQSVTPPAPYFAIEVDTTDAGITDPVQIVLFDASEGFQQKNNYFMPAAVAITGKGEPYQFILNDSAHVARYISMIQMTIVDGNGDAVQDTAGQFANVINFYESVVGRGPALVHTIYPAMGVHEGQFQLNINTFEAGITLTNRVSMVYYQEPGLKVTWGFYQGAELGRKQ